HSVVTSRQPQGVRGRAACDMRLAACGLWLSGRHLLMDERELIYDWNRAGGEGGPAFDWSRVRVDLNDETLRDGLQSPSVRDPALEVKKRLLHLMADLGIRWSGRFLTSSAGSRTEGDCRPSRSVSSFRSTRTRDQSNVGPPSPPARFQS